MPNAPSQPDPHAEHDILLTVTQVADRLSVSRASIHRLIQVRDLGHVRIGVRSIRVPQSGLETYIEARVVRQLV
ncbi:hypothetical protein BH24ACT15_BH24ACT15_27020 [soil metagenome]